MRLSLKEKSVKKNKLIIAVVLFFIIPLLIYGIFQYGVRAGKRIMFNDLKIVLEKAGVELIDGGKAKKGEQ